MFVRNCWYVAGRHYGLPPGQIIPRTIIGENLALYRRQDGGVVAIEDRCCHRLRAPLPQAFGGAFQTRSTSSPMKIGEFE